MGNWIDIRTCDGQFGAYLALPPSGHGPGLVICQEIFGVTEHMRAVADEMAAEGYVVAVPDLFWRQEPRVALSHQGDDLSRARALLASLDLESAVADIAATASALPGAGSEGGVGLLGFCLGGRLAVMAGAAGVGNCVVSYYGGGLEKNETRLRDVKVPLLLHFGANDSSITAATRDAVRSTLENHPDAETYIYPGVGHGFCNPMRESYNAAARGVAHSRTIALLRRVLGPRYDLTALWEAHRACEFETRDADATMATMVAEPYVNHVPTRTGGVGQAKLRDFYHHHFIHDNPADMRNLLVSRTVGADRVVNEGILSFTHDRVIDWMLPGVAPTGRRVEVAMVGIITFRGDKLVHEHIYWDQASVLVQIGLLDPALLPVSGAEAARKVLDASLPSNELIERAQGSFR